jgi:hypothetical protein
MEGKAQMSRNAVRASLNSLLDGFPVKASTTAMMQALSQGN